LQARYTQEFAAFAPITSKALVNSRWNKVVNIASTKMMKKISSSHSKGASATSEPGISRFPDAQLHI